MSVQDVRVFLLRMLCFEGIQYEAYDVDCRSRRSSSADLASDPLWLAGVKFATKFASVERYSGSVVSPRVLRSTDARLARWVDEYYERNQKELEASESAVFVQPHLARTSLQLITRLFIIRAGNTRSSLSLAFRETR